MSAWQPWYALALEWLARQQNEASSKDFFDGFTGRPSDLLIKQRLIHVPFDLVGVKHRIGIGPAVN